MSVVASQSLAIQDFTCEINPDSFSGNKTGKIRINVILSPGYLTEETGNSTSDQPRLKLMSLLVLWRGLYNHQYVD